jgi:hypothetical protein
MSVTRRRAKAAAKKASTLASFVPNGLKEDALNTILPAFAGYAGSKFLGRMAFVQISKRWPSLGKHTPVVASFVSLAATYILADKIEKLKKYRDPLIIGEAIALLQTVIQTYLPKFGWVVSDVSADQYAKPASVVTAALNAAPVRALPAPSASSDYDDLFDMTPVYNDNRVGVGDEDSAGIEETAQERYTGGQVGGDDDLSDIAGFADAAEG